MPKMGSPIWGILPKEQQGSGEAGEGFMLGMGHFCGHYIHENTNPHFSNTYRSMARAPGHHRIHHRRQGPRLVGGARRTEQRERGRIRGRWYSTRLQREPHRGNILAHGGAFRAKHARGMRFDPTGVRRAWPTPARGSSRLHRAAHGHDNRQQQMHNNRHLEIGWTHSEPFCLVDSIMAVINMAEEAKQVLEMAIPDHKREIYFQKESQNRNPYTKQSRSELVMHIYVTVYGPYMCTVAMHRSHRLRTQGLPAAGGAIQTCPPGYGSGT